MTGSCPFCRRVDRDEYDEEFAGPGGWQAITFEPLNPVTSGHRLFVPALHVSRPANNRGPVVAAFCAAMQWATTRPEDYNLILSQGPAATQTIEHLHIHYVPRREGDQLHLPWTGQHVA